MSVEIKKDRVSDVMAAIRELTTKEVLVGIPNIAAPRTEKEAKKRKGEPINNALIGYLNEFGSPAANIPERPHIRPGIDAAKDRIANKLKAGAKKALDGDQKAVEEALETAGQIAQFSVKRYIDTGPLKPLSPRTLEKRRASGNFDEDPLKDTLEYRRAITYVVAPKSKR